ncbi:Holliday junction resolvase RuvX [Sulfurimonas sp. HSL-3221]|uniref:Holliday junction resolvase RuvX n=1 Tax=Sulfurimonadaceae TaxID=2771471 RepID=UPI001E4C5393|nr:Holliday junction resolvase RuvX [Sulfurimonas sp. HSL-3221]UFS61724.1 Holliday junction resolvase RuvX [Sulfurimonas sp. HSL-3221]
MATQFPLLGIDLGLKRIGLAYSADGTVVTPLAAVERKNRNQASQAVRDVIAEWGIKQVVVGIPMGGSSEEEMRRRVAHFMNLVDFGCPVAYQDESDSSLEAEALMKGAVRYKRDGRVDSLSAMVILQRYLGQ